MTTTQTATSPASMPSRDSASQRFTIGITGMTCASCVGRVERALASLPHVETVSVNLATEQANVQGDAALALPDIIQTIERTGYEVAQTPVELAIEGMHCASCVGRVERVLNAVPGVTRASVNLATERAQVTVSAQTDDLHALTAAVERAGFTASPIHDRQADETSREARQELDQQHLRRDFLIAFVVTLPVFLLEMGGHMVPALHRFIDNTVGLQA